ncbi:MAG TPA: siphovirus Gp157 family protein [Burkholderiaceae bacterium]|nr:siphovirus Gp157 family protein [Burkholderiaceae bacterium]
MNILEAFEIASEIRTIGEQLRAEQPDQQAVNDTLDGLAWPLDEKLESLAKLRRMLAGARDARLERAESLREQALRDDAAIEHVESLIQSLLQASGRERAQTGLFSFALYKKAAVAAIDDATRIPEIYMRHPSPPPPAPDKHAILAALKAGKEVPGAHLEEGVRLSIK